MQPAITFSLVPTQRLWTKKEAFGIMYMVGLNQLEKRWVYIRLRVKLKEFLDELFPVNQRQFEIKRT